MKDKAPVAIPSVQGGVRRSCDTDIDKNIIAWYNHNMIRAIRRRIYPTEEQAQFFERNFGCARFVYNQLLERQIKNHEQGEKFANKYTMVHWLTELKIENPWLKEVDSRALQESMFALESGYLAFFRKNNDFPNFKSKKSAKQSYTTNANLKVFDKNIQIPKAKLVRYKGKSLKGIIPKKITISKSAGRYYASIMYDDGCPTPEKCPIKNPVGIDMGIKDYATLSDGKKYANSKLLSKSEERLKVLQRRLSKKQKGSNRRSRAKLKVARQHEKIRNQRQDFLHKLSNEITNQYDYVAIEDLSVANMVKNHKLAKAIEDCSWGEFARQLEYKTEWRGKTLRKIGRFEPSSKVCSTCGFVNHELTLADREWDCPECHTHHDRDINAAKNILVFSITAGTVGSGRGGANNG